MQPDAPTRSGTNKRAQLGVFAGYVFATLGAVIGGLLLVLSLWRPEAFNGLRSMAVDLASPVGHAGAFGRVGSQSFFETLAGYYEAGSKNAELERELNVARVRLQEARALRVENARLRAVLGLSRDAQRTVAVARLIGATSSSTRRFAFLAAGARDGVRPAMPVVSPMGLVGRVIEVGPSSARVLLLTDSESIVPVRRARDNVVAFAEGRADGTLRLRLIDLGVNPLAVGDVFVTSGAGGLFRPGIAVAVVAEVTEDGAIGRMLSNPAATDVVVVEPVWYPAAVEVLESDETVSPGEDEPSAASGGAENDAVTAATAEVATPSQTPAPAPAPEPSASSPPEAE